MKMRNISSLAAYEPLKLPEVYQELISKRMELDKEFSIFLEDNEWKMGENVDTPIWQKYRTMGETYTRLARDILLTEHYMKGI